MNDATLAGGLDARSDPPARASDSRGGAVGVGGCAARGVIGTMGTGTMGSRPARALSPGLGGCAARRRVRRCGRCGPAGREPAPRGWRPAARRAPQRSTGTQGWAVVRDFGGLGTRTGTSMRLTGIGGVRGCRIAAAWCSAGAATLPRPAWAHRRPPSCRPGLGPGVRGRVTGSSRDSARPRPAPGRPVPEDLTLERLLLLVQQLVGLPRACRVGRTAQRSRWTATASTPRPAASDPMTSTTNGTSGHQCLWPQIDRRHLRDQPSRRGARRPWVPSLARLCRAFAWLVLAAGACLRVGVVVGLERVGRLRPLRSVRLLAGVSRLVVMNHPFCQPFPAPEAVPTHCADCGRFPRHWPSRHHGSMR